MSDKTTKFWNNPVILLGLVVALIVIVVAVLYFFYTKLAHTKVKMEVMEKKIGDAHSSIASARTKHESTVAELEKKMTDMQTKLKALKKERQQPHQPSKKIVRCEEGNCEIEDA